MLGLIKEHIILQKQGKSDPLLEGDMRDLVNEHIILQKQTKDNPLLDEDAQEWLLDSDEVLPDENNNEN